MRTPTLAGFVLLLPAGVLGGCGLWNYKTTDTASPGAEAASDGEDSPADEVDTGLTGGSGAGSGSGSGDDGGGELLDISIDSVVPDHGLTAGGDTVTLTGGPFEPGMTVELGGLEAPLVRVSESELVVSTPATTAAGPTDITVESSVGQGRLDDAFRYWEDARGRYGLSGVVELARHTGTAWEGGTPADIHRATVFFTEPHLHRWYELFTPSLESCRSESTPSSAVLSFFDPGVEAIALVPASGTPLNLVYDGLGFTAEAPTVTAGSLYDLPAPGGILPDEDGIAVVEMPREFPSVSNPPIAVSDAPYVSQYHTFQWTPAGADWVLLTMTVDNGVTEDGYETVVCAANDDGEFDFDGSSFTLWSGRGQATVTVSFVYDQPEAILPWNQGLSSIAAMTTTIGTAFTY